MDSIIVKIYSFIQIVDKIIAVYDEKSSLNAIYNLPVSKRDTIELLSKLQVNSFKFSSNKKDIKSKTSFLRHLRNALCHNFFKMENGLLIIDYHYEGIKIEGNVSTSYFEKVMDDYLKLLGKAKGVKYDSFLSTDIFSDWNIKSTSEIANDMIANFAPTQEFEDSFLFFSKAVEKSVAIEDGNSILDAIINDDHYELDGIKLPSSFRKEFLNYVRSNRKLISKEPNAIFVGYYDKLLRKQSFEKQVELQARQSPDSDAKDYLVSLIESRKSNTLIILSKLSYYLGMINTSEKDNEFIDNDNVFLISFAGFDNDTFNSYDYTVNLYALFNDEAFSEYERDVVEQVRNNRARLLQRIRNSIMHSGMISLEYNNENQEFDVIFKYSGQKTGSKNGIYEIRIGTQQLSDFIEFIENYLRRKNESDFSYERNVHREFLDYVYSRSPSVDDYESYFANQDDLDKATSYDANYVFRDNRNVCRFALDFNLLLAKIKEADESMYNYFLNRLLNIRKLIYFRGSERERTMINLGFRDTYDSREEVTRIFREMISFINSKQNIKQ